MKRYIRKGMVIFLIFLLILGTTGGCSQKNQPADSGNQSSASIPTGQTTGSVYPLKTNVTLTFWSIINSNLLNFFLNLGEAPFGKELEKRTGIKVKYIHPAANQEREQFNLMIASGEIPDIVEYNWSSNYPGGPEKALGDGVILLLNDVLDKNAPNLKKLYASDKELEKQVKTDSGKHYVFPMVRGSDLQLVYRGPILRNDWLKAVGLQPPVTLDDWYVMLKAFKDKKNASAPFTFMYSAAGGASIENGFAGAYKTANEFYINDSGKVVFGPIEPQYKDFLALFKKWYAEGLLDKDFAVTDQKSLDSKMMGDKSGATVYLLSGGFQRWMDSMKEKNPAYELIGVTYPVLKKEDAPFIGQRAFKYNPGPSAAITKACKNVDVAARWLDYAFSEEGNLLFNFGIEGESYTMEKGHPKFTELITKNKNGNTMAQMTSQYLKLNGVFRGDDRYTEQVFTYPEQKTAVENWARTEAQKHNLPPFLTPTPEEAKDMAKILTDVKTYKEEMFTKFIMGVEPLENFDKYVEQVRKLGIEKATKINQDALERYNKR